MTATLLRGLLTRLPFRKSLSCMLATAALSTQPLWAAEVKCGCGSASPPASCGCTSEPPAEYLPYATPPAQLDPSSELSPGDDDFLVPPGFDQPPVPPDAASQPLAPPPAPTEPLLAASFGAATGAYSSAPNMMGDLFGPPGAGTLIGRRFICSAINESDRLFRCEQGTEAFQHENFQTFSEVAIDTNGDGLIDLVPNLVPTVVTAGNSSVAPQTTADPPKAQNGPFFGVATDLEDLGPGKAQILAADIFEELEIKGGSVGTSGPGLLLGRVKIAENNSPMPRDRVFVNYSHFNQVPIFPGGVNVNRITPGFEKTFYGGQMSLEFRVPFGTTLDNEITADGFTSTDQLLLGNMQLVYKALLLTGPRGAISGGLGLSLPTADDLTVRLSDGTNLLRLHNHSVHLSPYVAYLGAPTERLFVQFFLQGEFDLNGNRVDAQGSGGRLEEIGRVNDTNYLYFDVGAGYYLYRNRFDRIITSIAPIAELHWNKTLQPSDSIRTGGIQIGNFAENVDVLNGVIGLNMTVGADTSVTVGYTTPIGAGDNKQFDGEFRLLVNRYFGR